MRFLLPWLASIVSRKTSPEEDMPWLSYEAISWLNNDLKKDMATFEYGSGGSTLYFAKRVKKHVAVEHDLKWYEIVKERLKQEKINNVELLYVPLDGAGAENYSNAICGYAGTFDIILIDGRNRNSCAAIASRKIAGDGCIVFDNSDRTEYFKALERLAQFDRKDFRGFGPINAYPIQTSIFKARRSFGLNSLDLKLEPYLSGIKNGFFVEAGASDGVNQSNTLFFEKEHGWRGLLVEAIPELAEKCRSNRPAAIVENAALISKDFREPAVTMRYAGLMSVVKGGMLTKTEEDEHVRIGLKRLNAESREISVPAGTLTGILEKHGISKIDFLSLDVEGYELQALQGLDFGKYRPSYILVEARYKDDIDSFMKSVGYNEIAKLSHHDYLYSPKIKTS